MQHLTKIIATDSPVADTMMTLSDVRKAIKPLGYKLKTQLMSWGRHATYIHIASGQAMTFNVFTADLVERWKPLFDWRKAHNEGLQRVRENENVRGLV